MTAACMSSGSTRTPAVASTSSGVVDHKAAGTCSGGEKG
jgi:hypothetical protein